MRQIVLILILGLGIGGLTPWILQKWPIHEHAALKTDQPKISDMEAQVVSAPHSEDYYYCRIENGVLSIVQGLPSQGGKRMITGLEVSNWPPEMLEMAEKIEFHSLDEVQSFIDSISEELWTE